MQGLWQCSVILSFIIDILNDDLIFHYVCLRLGAWFLVVARGMSPFCFFLFS